jgi:uncharacterized delta-60 repeat protein
MAAARFNADGTPDTTFGGGDGQTTVPFIGSAAADGALVTGGRILLAGSRDGHFALARLMSDGSPDTTFSGDGRTYNLSGATAEAVAVQTDGTFWVAGSPTQDGVLGKYAANGTPAFGFGGGDGRVFTDFGATPRRLYADAMVREADGRLALAGVVRHTYEDTDVAIGRFLTDGSPDPAFVDGGGRVTDTGDDGAAHALLRQSDGKYVVVGEHGDDDALVARYLGG